MKLHQKIVLLLLLPLALLIAGVHWVCSEIIREQFAELEHAKVLRDARRIELAVASQLESIARTTRDWALWDETYAFTTGEDPLYIARNLNTDSLVNIGLDFMVIYDAMGNVIASVQCEADAPTLEEIPPSMLACLEGARRRLVESPKGRVSGAVVDGENLALVTGQSVRASDRSLPAAGTLLAGVYANRSFVAEICKTTQLDFRLVPLPAELRQSRPAQVRGTAEHPEILVTGPDTVEGRFRLYDLNGYAGFQGVLRQTRALHAQGELVLSYILFSLSIVCLVACLALHLLLHRIVLAPLGRLGKSVHQIATSGDLATRAEARGSDEIADLARNFNAMVGSLADTQEELLKARRRAEMADAAKTQFLAFMSHEIRSPLSAISGFAEMLEDEGESQRREERLEMVRTIRTSSEHLLSLLEEVLDFSSIEAGSTPLELAVFSPWTLALETCAVLKPLAIKKGITLRAERSGPLSEFILSDPRRYRQVLTNLIVNAIKFNDHCSVLLRMHVAVNDATGYPMLFVEVSDPGIGMSPEQVAGLFQPYGQGSASATRRFGGTGLGLLISKKLAQLLGGDLTVVSELGRGTTFTFTLRTGGVAQAAGESAAGTNTTPPPDQGVNYPHGPTPPPEPTTDQSAEPVHAD